MRSFSRLIHRIAHRRKLRRYRNAFYVHADLRTETEVSFVSKLWRILFRSGHSGASRRTMRIVARIRFAIMLLLAWLLMWFIVENLFLWDFFSGD